MKYGKVNVIICIHEIRSRVYLEAGEKHLFPEPWLAEAGVSVKSVRYFKKIGSGLVTLWAVSSCLTSCIPGNAGSSAIVCKDTNSLQQMLAARELQRYLYLRTDVLLPIKNQIPIKGKSIVISRDTSLDPQQYSLKTQSRGARRILYISGGSDLACLYGAYHIAEKLGVRFYLHGDVIPDRKTALDLPELDEKHQPLFKLRGLNPWGSHPFGFDFWNTDAYIAHLGQMAKMRMNFIGMHCYPEDKPYAEPTVWTGLHEDFQKNGRVNFSYPARYTNTLWRGYWGPILPRKTSEYVFGGSLLFERDDWGPDVMQDLCPSPTTLEESNTLFSRTGQQFDIAFTFAQKVGIKTCLGTESPLTIPQALQYRLRSQGRDPGDPAVIQQVYEGIFSRIMATHPLDYYWFWTPETWLWKDNTIEEFQDVVKDIEIACKALERLKAPFQPATSGWVLGPKHDRSAFHKAIPGSIPVSCITEMFSFIPLDENYGKMEGRKTWAIPWMESDNYLANPQIFVSRSRKDAADALAYGCEGLMGLIWRTRIIAPTISALAQAGWRQPWNPEPGKIMPNVTPEPISLSEVFPATPGHRPHVPRGMYSHDFWLDWSETQFGPAVAGEAAEIFELLDGRLPQSLKSSCPAGAIEPLHQDWSELSGDFAFVDRLAELRSGVRSAGSRERFDYWLNTFRYQRELAHLRCRLGKFHEVMEAVEALESSEDQRSQAYEKALPNYRTLIQQFRHVYTLLLSTVNTLGGMATVMNLEQNRFWRQSRIDDCTERLKKTLGGTLPEDAKMLQDYQGEARLIIPIVRTHIEPGESLKLKVIVLDNGQPKTANLYWRTMGRGGYKEIELDPVARGVYSVSLPAAEQSMEYYIQVRTSSDKELIWPATAPHINQTLVEMPDVEIKNTGSRCP